VIAAQLIATNGRSARGLLLRSARRDELLAGAAFSGNQHGGIGRRNPPDAPVERPHHRAVADHRMIEVELRLQAGVLVGERLRMLLVGEGGGRDRGDRHQQPQLSFVERLVRRVGLQIDRTERLVEGHERAARTALRRCRSRRHHADEVVQHPVDHRPARVPRPGGAGPAFAA
jgi:hypothetical protein